MYRIGIVGHRPEYVSDRDALKRTIDRTIDLISYQYGEDLVINVGGDIGTGHWALKSCVSRNIRYHLFLPCQADVFSGEWYDDQRVFLNECFKTSWAVTINSLEYSSETEKKTYEHIVDMSDFIICFWNGMRQGPTFECIEYALKHNKLTINGSNDLKLITNDDMREKSK
jgi:hypothetical protein